jgi:hypothetical protein
MNTSETIIDLKGLVTSLIDPQINPNYAEKIINKIHEYFSEVTQVSGQGSDINHLYSVPANTGMALSINHAAQCLLDYKRTIKFLNAFVQAINDKREQFPGEVIRVFYAGCGPYATFVTLIAPLFNSDEIQFSLLEINKDSLCQAEQLIENLKLTKYIKACYLSDATTFEIPQPETFHILFSETLDALLYRECYVPILWNLLPQLPNDITVIPENVSVNLYFKKGDKETFSTTIFDARKAVKNDFDALPEQFESVIIDLSNSAKYDRILLETDVKIYKNIKLERNESSLTLSLEMEIEKPMTYTFVAFTYHTQPQIELKLKMLD